MHIMYLYIVLLAKSTRRAIFYFDHNFFMLQLSAQGEVAWSGWTALAENTGRLLLATGVDPQVRTGPFSSPAEVALIWNTGVIFAC